MIYTFFIFGLGVFVGQEYKSVPSVKTYVFGTLNYLKNYDFNTETHNSESNTDNKFPTTFINFDLLKQFFKKNDD